MPKSGNAEEQGGEELNLPWLQAVHERAVHQTGALNPDQVKERPESAPTGPSQPKEASPQRASSPEPAQREPQAQEQAQETAEAVQPPEKGPDPGEAPPEWVVGILEPDTTPQAPEEPYEPEELAHIMPWLGGAPTEGGETTPGGEAGLPPWLSGITVQETLETRAPTPEKKTETNAVPDLELEGVEPFVPPDIQAEEAQAGTEAAQGGEASTPASSRPKEKVPEWLKSIASRGEQAEKQAPEAQPSLERITPVTRVVLTPTETLGHPTIREVPVKPPRPGAVETLAALIQPATEEQAVSRAVPSPAEGAERAASRSGVAKWLLPDGLIYLVILAALLAVLLIKPPFGQVSAPGATDAIEFYNAVDNAPRTKPVLVVYDWDASRSAEMMALSTAVTHHLMSRHIQFVTISTVPQGPGFAQQITQDVAGDTHANYGYEYGRDYLVLGYLPGGEAALRALSGDLNTVLPVDYVNNRSISASQIGQGGKLKSIGDFGMIIDLASDETAMRTWIEQVAVRTSLPIVAAVPQALEPLARPYKHVRGAGLNAVVSGQAGALQYIDQLSSHGLATGIYTPGSIADRLNAQSVAQLIVALVIVAAFVSMGTRRIFRR